jgi:hypothetical protein
MAAWQETEGLLWGQGDGIKKRSKNVKAKWPTQTEDNSTNTTANK